ncbi:MAG TPA: phosphoglycerate mutase family protein [Chthoniobacterales bacterium]|nr:phosphoglycerate mutase family protein [Chthoniobacterales bacterium]
MRFFILPLSIFAAISVASAEPIIVIVRHAEKIDNSEDADLSPAGRTRADALARILKDAHITAIFTSERKRTQETAAPLAKSNGIAPTIVPAKDYNTLVSKLRRVHGAALIVGHGNTIPDIIKALGVDTPVQISDDDYTDLFVVALQDKPQLLRLHY